MAIFKCKMCGGSLEIGNETVATCEYCGTQQTLPKTTDEVVSNLFNRANNLRLKCEFDKAAQIYEKIVEQDDSEAEAHWGLVLCKYGIEYVEDPKTFQRIPTCHRTLFEAVTTDADYQAAIDYSDAGQQQIYEAEARAIDKIQRDILSIVKNEKPFDVFICYKETDESGKRTVDSAIANDIYHQLTQEGFKVFYAAITLEDKLGQEYEPYIFAALNSAKVMLVLGTKPEFFSSVWVKNEWSRFLQLMKSDRSKLLIPCYRDMDAYDLPEEFAHLQAQDMSKIGFINDVIRGIKKISKTTKSEVTIVKETAVSNSESLNIAPLIERAFLFAEDGEWDSADEYCEKILDLDPRNARAYLCKLLVELRINTLDGLKDCDQPFGSSNNYQKILRFGDEELKAVLADHISAINNRKENARLDGIYSWAKNAMLTARTESSYKEAASRFETISHYQDSAALAQECYEKAEAARKDEILFDGNARMTSNVIFKLETAIKLFESIPGWKDADEKILQCQEKIENLKAKTERERLEKVRRAELAQIAKEKKIKLFKKIALVVSLIVVVMVAFIILLSTVIIPAVKYNEANALFNEGNVDEAYAIFNELENYKDSVEKAGNIRLTKTKETLQNIKVGDYIKFGAYEQDNDASNGKEGVEWRILKIENEKVLIISKYALDCQPYHATNESATWETCSLRKWLNNDFINSAFSEEEKARIPTVKVAADKNATTGSDVGNSTEDKVFLLSIMEAKEYLNHDALLQCEATTYSDARGVYTQSSRLVCDYWLRTTGVSQFYASFVNNAGSLGYRGARIDDTDMGVRPAMWIDLNAN